MLCCTFGNGNSIFASDCWDVCMCIYMLVDLLTEKSNCKHIIQNYRSGMDKTTQNLVSSTEIFFMCMNTKQSGAISTARWISASDSIKIPGKLLPKMNSKNSTRVGEYLTS